MATPFLKWAGGKGRLADTILAVAPDRFGTYHEPFLGGGAVFFALCRAGRGGKAALSDLNGELVAAYRQVRDDVDSLISSLELLHEGYLASDHAARAQIYYGVRAATPRSAAASAARTIFLNKTCYNGLYRVNRKGVFNVPHGDYAKPAILDEQALRACSACLSGAVLEQTDFTTACAAANAGDLVYLDPPYHPLSPTSNFTSYTDSDFGEDEQRALAEVFVDLTDRGVFALLSNSDHPLIRDLYARPGLHTTQVTATRSINSNGSGRGRVSELLITNLTALKCVSHAKSSPK